MTTATLSSDEIREKVAAILDKTPGQMTPVIARQLGINEAEVLRHFPGQFSTELDGGRATELIQEFEQLGRVHVICSNGDCILEAYGYFGGFSKAMGFLNVQTDSLDMHIKATNIKYAFALIKPSHQDGQSTYSFQFFNEDGRSVFKVFVYKSVSEADGDEIAQRVGVWEALSAQYKLTA